MKLARTLAGFALAGAALFALSTPSQSAQPNMQAALDNLMQARANLQRAVADKGGHRANALSLVDQAIEEVRAGIDYARTH